MEGPSQRIAYQPATKPQLPAAKRRGVGLAPPAEALAAPSASPHADHGPTPARAPRHWAWAALMRRAFDIDVLACPRCGGRLRLLATVDDPDAIRAILTAAAEQREPAGRAPPSAATPTTTHAAALGA